MLDKSTLSVAKIKGILDTEKAKIEAMVQSLEDGLIMTDTDGNFVICNAEAKELLALESKEINLQTIEEAFNELGFNLHFNELIAGKKVVVGKQVEVKRHLSRKYFCSATPIENSSGTIVGIVILIRDITTDTKEDELKTDFINSVSHELRTPLSVVTEGLSLVKDEIPGALNSEQKEIIETSSRNVERLTHIVDGILDMSMLELGKIDLEFKMVDLRDVFKEVVQFFNSRISSSAVEFKMDLPNEKVEVQIDRDKVLRVIVQLLGNAYKFTQKGVIECAIKDMGDTYECSISDSGIGIAKKDLSKVFTKFQQFERVSGSGEKGTGLGLAIAKGIVNLHKGKIWAVSELGKGSKFTFSLPKPNQRGQDGKKDINL